MNAATKQEQNNELARIVAQCARNAIPILVSLGDGLVIAGVVAVFWNDSILIEEHDGARVRVSLDAIDHISRRGGRALWTRCA